MWQRLKLLLKRSVKKGDSTRTKVKYKIAGGFDGLCVFYAVNLIFMRTVVQAEYMTMCHHQHPSFWLDAHHMNGKNVLCIHISTLHALMDIIVLKAEKNEGKFSFYIFSVWAFTLSIKSVFVKVSVNHIQRRLHPPPKPSDVLFSYKNFPYEKVNF